MNKHNIELPLKDKVQKENKNKNIKVRFYYSFMTIVLVICLAQIGYSFLLNLSKIVAYQGKIHQSTDLKAKALSDNKRLKTELEEFSSIKRAETIARNNLKMVGENEVLVIINEPPKPVVEKNKNILPKLINTKEKASSL